MNSVTHSAVDVLAYQDVVIHLRTTPRSARGLQAFAADLSVFRDTASEDWPALHEAYRRQFAVYLHDARALNYRDERQRKMKAAQQRRRR